MKTTRPTPHLDLFLRWSEEAVAYAGCTVRQRLEAYIGAYPGQALPLIEELVRIAMESLDEQEQDSDRDHIN